MSDPFGDSFSAQIREISQTMLRNLQVGEKEVQVFLMFYDEKLKTHRDKVPKFHIYARLCDGKLVDSWSKIMNDVDGAILNLKTADLIVDAKASPFKTLLEYHVGRSAEMYRLTDLGLTQLQRLRPSVALNLRGWIAVMPPWLVLVGSVAGGVAAVWKAVELTLTLL